MRARKCTALVPLSVSHSMPLHRRWTVLSHAMAILVHDPEIGLLAWLASLVCGYSIPLLAAG